MKWDAVVVYKLIPEAPAGNDKIGSFIQASAGAPDTLGRDKDGGRQTDTRQGRAELRDRGRTDGQHIKSALFRSGSCDGVGAAGVAAE